jgi:hypothetical protein
MTYVRGLLGVGVRRLRKGTDARVVEIIVDDGAPRTYAC